MQIHDWLHSLRRRPVVARRGSARRAARTAARAADVLETRTMLSAVAVQNFNGIAADPVNTDAFADGAVRQELTNGGSKSANAAAGLTFTSFFTDTDGGGGPIQNETGTDLIGVSSNTGGGFPAASPTGVPVADGSEHNFVFEDTDGLVEVDFGSIDLTGETNRQFSLSYWVASTGYEASDLFEVTLSDGTNSFTALSISEPELEANGGTWETLTVDLEDLIATQGFGETFAVTVSAATNSGSERIFIDDLTFSAGADVDAPIFVGSTPANGSNTVDAATDITLSFNEEIVAAAGDVSVFRADDDTLVGSFSVTGSDVTVAGQTLTLNPPADLDGSTEFYVTLDAGAVEDLAGNAGPAIAANELQFTTAAVGLTAVDTDFLGTIHTDGDQGPNDFYGSGNDDNFSEYGVASFAITKADLGIGSGDTVDTLDQLVLRLTHEAQFFADGTQVEFFFTDDDFAGDYTGLTYNSALTNGIDASQYASAPVSLGVFDYTPRADGTPEEFDLDISAVSSAIISEINAGGEFSILIGAVASDADTTFEGLDENGPQLLVDFTSSAGADTTAPTLLSSNPADEDVNVSPTGPFTFTFDEVVQAGTGDFEVRLASDDSLVAAYDVAGPSVDFTGDTVTLTPPTALDLSTDYYFTVAPTAVLDAAGNAFAGISDPTALNFSTGLASLAAFDSGSIHTDGDRGSAEFYATGNGNDPFSEYGIASFQFDKSDLGIGPNDTVDSVNTAELTLTHNDRNFSGGIAYELFLTVDTFDADYTGLAFDINLTNGIDAAQFTSAPVSLGTFNYIPEPGGTTETVTLDLTNVNQTLTTALDAGAPFSILIGATDAFDQITFSGVNNGFDPGDPKLSLDVNSTAGNDTQAPTIAALDPADDETGVGLAPTLTATFDETLVAGSGAVTLFNADGSIVQTFFVGADAVVSGTTLSVTPDDPLAPNAGYYVTIEAGAVQDAAGNAFAGLTDPAAWNFTTGLANVDLFAQGSIHIDGAGNGGVNGNGDEGPGPFYGSGNGDAFAEYGIGSFQFTAADLGVESGSAVDIDALNDVTLTLFHEARGFSGGTEVEFFLTTDAFAGNFDGLTYDANVVNGIDASQYAFDPVSLGVFSYTPQADGTQETFSLDLASAGPALIAALEAEAEFNILIAATEATADVTFYGLSAAEPQFAPNLAIDATFASGGEAPVVDRVNATSRFVEDRGPAFFARSARVNDADSADFGGAVLEIEVDGGLAEDFVGFVDGDGVTAGAGDFSAGTSVVTIARPGQGDVPVADAVYSGSSLAVTFRPGTTNQDVTRVLRRAAYLNDSDSPTTPGRVITVQVTDGEGNASLVGAGTVSQVNLVAVADNPVLTGVLAGAEYTEGGGPVALTGPVTVTDADTTDFGGGRLDVVVRTPRDVGDLFVLDVAADAGVTVDTVGPGATVSVDGAAVATLQRGTVASRMVIDFLAGASADDVARIAQLVRFDSTSDAPRGPKTFRFTLSDPAGGRGVVQEALTVNTVNDPPSILNVSGRTTSVTEGAGPQVLASSFAVSDPDYAGGGGVLSVALPAAPAGVGVVIAPDGSGRVTVSGTDVLFQGTVIGTASGLGTSSASVAFNAAATAGAVRSVGRLMAAEASAGSTVGTTDVEWDFQDELGADAATAAMSLDVRPAAAFGGGGSSMAAFGGPSAGVLDGVFAAGGDDEWWAV